MSCWCTTSRLGFSPEAAMVSDGASSRVTVRPGPRMAESPAGTSSRSIVSFTSVAPAVFSPAVSSSTSSASSLRSALRASTSSVACCTTVDRSPYRPARRSVPSELTALVTNSAPATTNTAGPPSRQPILRLR